MIPRTLCLIACLVVLSPVAARGQLTIRRENPVEVASRLIAGNVVLDTMAKWTHVTAPRSQSYTAALRVLEHQLQLPVERSDSARGVAYNTRLVVRRTLAGRPVSRWVRCGSGMTGDYADSWRVNIAYAVYVDSDTANTTRLGVALFASATNIEGTSTGSLLCGTTGALEDEIARLVRLATVLRPAG